MDAVSLALVADRHVVVLRTDALGDNHMLTVLDVDSRVLVIVCKYSANDDVVRVSAALLVVSDNYTAASWGTRTKKTRNEACHFEIRNRDESTSEYCFKHFPKANNVCSSGCQAAMQ